MKKKYLLIGGEIYSKYDGELHYINAHKLCQLYNLNPIECIFAEANIPETWLGYDGLIELYPMSNANYKL